MFKRKIVTPVLQILKQGTQPTELSLAIVLAVYVGTFPIIGSTTLLCLIVAWAFRLNWAIMQIVNYSIYPLQIALIVPFMILGKQLIFKRAIPPDIDTFVSLFQNNFWQALLQFRDMIINAIAAWFIIVTPLMLLFYPVLKHIFIKIRKSYAENQDSTPKHAKLSTKSV